MSTEDVERRLHWLRLARELGAEDDFRALMDDLKREGASQAFSREALATAAHRYYCVMPNEPAHAPDETDYDKADEILEILAAVPRAAGVGQ